MRLEAHAGLRNLFDLYSGKENRYTFALLYLLDRGRRTLLSSFIRKFTAGGKHFPKGLPLDRRAAKEARILAQVASSAAANQGLRGPATGVPDGGIRWEVDDKPYGILIESKVGAALNDPQLKRHLKKISSEEWRGAALLVILPFDPAPGRFCRGGQGTYTDPLRVPIRWAEICKWLKEDVLRAFSRPSIENLLATELLRLLEKEEKMTDFTGVSFPNDYEYERAKEILRKVVSEAKGACKSIPEFKDFVGHRPGITDDGHYVWNVLGDPKGHTRDIHVTFVLYRDKLHVALTLPNAARGRYWSALAKASSRDSFRRQFEKIAADLRREGNSVVIKLHQRHAESPSRFGPRSDDAKLRFKIDTGLNGKKWEPDVKAAPVWIESLFRILAQGKRERNWELQVSVHWYLKPEGRSDRPEFLKDILGSVKGLAPLARLMVSLTKRGSRDG